jgi:hypothetical protein
MNITRQSGLSPGRSSGKLKDLHKSGFSFPKQTLPGSVHIEWKKCGRPWCHCAKGKRLHGPYYYRRWRENGKQKRAYVKMKDLEETLLAVELHKSERPSISYIKASLKQVSIQIY